MCGRGMNLLSKQTCFAHVFSPFSPNLDWPIPLPTVLVAANPSFWPEEVEESNVYQSHQLLLFTQQ